MLILAVPCCSLLFLAAGCCSVLPVVAPCCSLLFSGLLELAAQPDFTADHGSAIGSTGPREENSQLKLAIPADHGSVIGSAPPPERVTAIIMIIMIIINHQRYNAKTEPLFDTSS